MRVRIGFATALGFAGCQALLSPTTSPPRPPVRETPPMIGAANRVEAATVVAAGGLHLSPGPSPLRGGEQEGGRLPPTPSDTTPLAPPSFSGKGDGGLGSDDPLILAAKCLEAGDQAGAVPHLASHVRRHPEQVMFRANLAEVLFRLGHPDEAREQFERFIADAQPLTGAPRKHLVHCHTRLMDLGHESGDRFAELLHRGVGLLLLATDAESSGSAADDGFREEMLCKAIRALRDAKELRPADPRVNAYLADAHARAGNPRAADECRRVAWANQSPGDLTPEESRRVTVAEIR